MPEPILNLRLDLPPTAVAERLVAAAASAPRVHGEAFEVVVRGEALSISPPPPDYEGARAVCRGSLIAEGSGSVVRLEAAALPRAVRILLVAIGGAAGAIAALVAVNAWRKGSADGVWGAIGAVTFVGLVAVLVSVATTARAGGEARAFVRGALESSERQAAG